MEFGCHLPVYGPTATRAVLLGVARRLEALGYDALWVSDHVVIPWRIESRYPYSPTGDFPLPPATDFLEPLTALALVAGATERIRLGTSVLVVPHRHPLLAAKMLATLDHLAPGRVILGAGVGWMREEIELLGAPYGERGAWSDEAIALMRACWRDERVDFLGRFFRVDGVACRPRPARGTIPIWIGGHAPRALDRVARLGDGWQAAFPTLEGLSKGVADLRDACRSTGRDFSTLTLSARIGLPARRSADAMISELRALRDTGVHHIVLEPRATGLDDTIAIFERFAHEVRPNI
jgi:probable F420-dependent oxidoreductase